MVALDSVLLSATMAVAAGLIGSFSLMRRMTLAADALSHFALPGIGLAIVLRVNPMVGALAALIGGAVLVWGLEKRSRVASETAIGVIFSAALAAGALLTTREELVEALFGAPGTLAAWELAAGILGAAAVIAFVLRAKDRLIIMLVSRDVARTVGVNVNRLSLHFLLAFALTVALGLRYLGVLLMGSLLIIAPATARRVARNLTGMLAISAGVAVISTIAGMWLAGTLQRESGPLIVLVATACFLLAVVIRVRA